MSAADWLRYAEAIPAGTPDNSLTAIANAVTGLLAAVVETTDRDRGERTAYRLFDRADAALARVLAACDDIEAQSLGDANLRTAAAQVRAAINEPSERERAEAWVREHAADVVDDLGPERCVSEREIDHESHLWYEGYDRTLRLCLGGEPR